MITLHSIEKESNLLTPDEILAIRNIHRMGYTTFRRTPNEWWWDIRGEGPFWGDWIRDVDLRAWPPDERSMTNLPEFNPTWIHPARTGEV